MASAFEASVRQIGERVRAMFGLAFSPSRFGDLERGVKAAAGELGFTNAETGAASLAAEELTGRELQALANHLTVGETYFFRDRAAFDVIEEVVLPELISAKSDTRKLRIWSAACCTGEEAYSLAVAVQRVLPSWTKWDIKIVGSDLNSRFLERARCGVFGAWSFRETQPSFRERFFRKVADTRWEIRADLRAMVEFRPFNIASGGSPCPGETFDLILCRNALIYFSAEKAVQVVEELTRNLDEGAWLLLGPNETHLVERTELRARQFESALFFQKRTGPSNTPENPRFSWRTAAAEPSEGGSPTENSSPAAFDVPAANEFTERTSPSDAPDSLSNAVSSGESVVPAGEAPEALLEPVRKLADQGFPDDALAEWNRLMPRIKMIPAAHYLQASILLALGRATEAEVALGRVLYLDAEHVLTHFALGQLLRNRGRVRHADDHLATAERLARALPTESLLPDGDGLTAGQFAATVATLRTPTAS